MDLVGRGLIGMVREWVEWVGKQSGRESVSKLSGTSGRECEFGTETLFQWKPTIVMRTKDGGRMGDNLTTVTGERTETRVCAADKPRELERMKNNGKLSTRMETDGGDGDEDRLQCEDNGISLEGEFAFGRAVGEFLKEEVRAGTFKGNYILNLKDQMRLREMREMESGKRLRVMLVGASQMWRLGEELMRKDGVDVTGCVLMEAENTVKRNTEMLRELQKKKSEVDVVVVGGPTNSLVRHGKEGSRGFRGERIVKVSKSESGREEWKVTYHLTDPVKINMVEKAELVDRFVDMLQKVKEVVGEKVVVAQVTMFPRFVRECCKKHMTDEDVWLLDGVRRDVNKDIVDRVNDNGLRIETIDWWTLLGAREEMTLSELRRADCVDDDNVHLRVKTNKDAAEILFHRLLETVRESGRGESSGKKRRMV
jgi:hypothetical protein